MAGKLGSLTIDIGADLAHLRRDMSSAEKTIKSSTDQMAKRAASAKKALGAIAGALAVGGVTSSIIEATRKQEAAVKQLEQGLASTGGVVGRSLDELVKKAGELQNATTFGDEDIIAAQSKLVTFTKVIDEQFDKTIDAALDLSARMGTDLTSSVVQLGKALNDPVKNLSALSRAGIQFTDSQKDLIKNLVETNRLADAQKIILSELETQFGGSAEAARDTFGGSLTGLSNAFGDLFEASGSLDDAKNSIEDLTQLLQDPKTIEAANKLASGIISAFSGVAESVVTTTEVFGYLKDEIAAQGGFVKDDDYVRLEQAISDTNDQIERLISYQSGARGVLANVLGLDDDYAERLDEANQKLEELTAKRDSILAGGSASPKGSDSDSGSPVQIAPVLDRDALEKELKELDKIIEREAKALKTKAGSITISVRTDNESFAENVKELDSLLGKGLITQETYNRKLQEYKDTLNEATPGLQSFKEIHEALTDTLTPQESALDKVREQIVDLVVAMDTFPDKADAISDALIRLREEEAAIVESIADENLEKNGDFWEKYLASAEESLTSLDELAANTIESFSSGFGDAFEELIMEGGSFRDSMGSFMVDITGAFVNAVGQMIAQWAAYKVAQFVISKTALAAETTASAAAGSATAAAWAPAAAMASLASFGANSAPASAGILATTALAKAASVASFDGGGFTGSGPRTGGLDGKGGFVAMLHPNETVIDHTRGQAVALKPTFNFPSVTNAQEAKRAAGQAGREWDKYAKRSKRYT